MSDYGKIPRGIRQNNPGNLRHAWRAPSRVPVVDGFAQFATPVEGCLNLLMLIVDYYSVEGYQVPFDFVSHYAPSTENDVQAYIGNLGKLCLWGQIDPHTFDMRLDARVNALRLAMAITAIENGRPLASWPASPQWIAPDVWGLAARLVEYTGRSWVS